MLTDEELAAMRERAAETSPDETHFRLKLDRRVLLAEVEWLRGYVERLEKSQDALADLAAGLADDNLTAKGIKHVNEEIDSLLATREP